MTISSTDSAQAGARVYSEFVLRFYDLVVLGLSNTIAWRCPSSRILEFYNQHVSANHLDIGVGTGYFLDKCRFPTDAPQITLMDLNPSSLRVTARRLIRYQPVICVGNVLEPLPVALPKFDSIGLSYLIHCLPGSMSEKMMIFRHLKSVLNPGGVIFGTTILGEGTPHNLPAWLLMRLYNQTGLFGNVNDTFAALEHGLQENFSTYTLTVVGCVAFFTGQS